jgi:hypothetical protein
MKEWVSEANDRFLFMGRPRALPHLRFAPAWPRRSESMRLMLKRSYGVTLRAEGFAHTRWWRVLKPDHQRDTGDESTYELPLRDLTYRSGS